MLEQIREILKKQTNIQPTLLYNEGWMLRLVLNWFANEKNRGIEHELSIPEGPDYSWFSEALLPSPFLRGQAGREGYTHADGVVGKFCIGEDKKKKGKLSLKPDCDFFYVVEAKMGSSLSSGIANAAEYNQAARNIACIAELLAQQEFTKENIENFKHLGFYVFLPEEHRDLKNGKIKSILDPKEIKRNIIDRMSSFDNDSIHWLKDNLDSFLNKLTVKEINIKTITWEEIISFIKNQEPKYGSQLDAFYKQCIKFN